MMTAKLSGMMDHLGRGDTADSRSATDSELLTLFIANRDEEAFAELVRRHGRLVFGVCRRVTGNHHFAEDAFQAVFVVLATKAAAVRPPSAIAAWLHRVAWRTAMRARTMTDRRCRREARVAALTEPTSSPTDEVPDAIAILDEEIARLPEHFRLPLVLCELEGQSRRNVARQLRVPEGTLSSRLAAARKRLADRLRQRGIALSTAALTTALDQAAASAKPSVALIAKAAIAVTRDTIPAQVAILSSGVLRSMFFEKLKTSFQLTLLATALITCATAAAVPTAPQASRTVPQLYVMRPLPDAARIAEPPPAKVDPKPIPKGPNKLLLYRAGNLTMMNPDGTNEKQVIEGQAEFGVGAAARLSPDGKKLAFAVCREAHFFPPDENQEQAKHWLYVRELTEPEPGTDLKISCSGFVWSPDGTKIITNETVEGPDNKPTTVHCLVDVKTKEKKTPKLPDGHVITDWSPDGKYYLTTSVTKNIFRMSLMSADGSECKTLTEDDQSARLGRISPDGKKVLYLSFGPLVNGIDGQRSVAPNTQDLLHVLDITSGKRTPVSDLPAEGEILAYCWSPDGKQIAYTWREKRIGEKVESSLVICDPDGKNPKSVTSEKGLGGVVTIGGVDWR